MADQVPVAHVTTRDEGSIVVIAPTGELDIASVYLLRDSIVEALARSSTIVLEMSQVTFVDSTTLGVIIGGHRQVAGRAGGWLRIVAPQASVFRVLQLMAIDSLIGVYDTVEQAILAPGGLATGPGGPAVLT